MNFDRLVSLLGEEFKKSPNHFHVWDFPMFSIYVKKEHKTKFFQTVPYIEDFKKVFADARNAIIKMGFTSMHVNVLFDDLSDEVNKNTGGGVGGYAHRKGKFMSISIRHIGNLPYLKKVIIHEWAHLWMFNNSAGFKQAVKKFYEQLLDKSEMVFLKRNIKISNNFYQAMIKSFADLLCDAYHDELTYRLEPNEIHSRMRSDHHVIKRNVSKMPRVAINSFNPLIYPDKISLEEMIPKMQSELKEKTISDILQSNIYRYINNSITNDLVDYMAEYGIDYDDGLSDRDLKDFYKMLMSEKTKHNSYICHPKGASELEILKSFQQSYKGRNYIHTIIIEYFDFLKAEYDKKQSKTSYNLSGEKFNSLRDRVTKLMEWVNSYGMSNDLELWATGVEDFVKLPPRYKKEIMNLMQTQDRRELPNRTMRKKMK